ncbi:acyl carrier protein [Streptomyces sp. NPDC001262]|uniref:acyl carrier protein n=1 Tax=Streptomyces TaxID=1883 RepID=UPI0036C33FCD
MSTFTIDDLREIMSTNSGVDEGVDLDGDIADVEFALLGYDSLAVLDLLADVQHRYGVEIHDSCVARMTTPARTIEIINQQLTAAEV